MLQPAPELPMGRRDSVITGAAPPAIYADVTRFTAAVKYRTAPRRAHATPRYIVAPRVKPRRATAG